MAENQIQPHKVTKPIQLVAAWLAGLVVIDAMFLGAAKSLGVETWIHILLVVAAVINVPIFLGAIFLLQTKFRAELQEDSFYSEYLSKRTSQVVRIDKNSEQDAKISSLELKVASLEQSTALMPAHSSNHQNKTTRWGRWLVAVNGLHPQLDEIVTALNTAGIPVETIFGQEKSSTIPERWAISISHEIPAEFQVELLKVLIVFNFSGFHRWEPRREAEELEDVYVGGYGNDWIVPFDDRLKKLLSRTTAAKLIDAYCQAAVTEAN